MNKKIMAAGILLLLIPGCMEGGEKTCPEIQDIGQRDLCYSLQAKNECNPDICNQISEIAGQTTCIQTEAEGCQQAGDCMRIQNTAQQVTCIYDAARTRDDCEHMGANQHTSVLTGDTINIQECIKKVDELKDLEEPGDNTPAGGIG